MKNTKKYELIVVVVNQGFTDAIIKAATKAKATGGTMLSARCLAKDEAIKNYGLPIKGDKDIVLILAELKTKKAIMEAIYKVSGIETKGMALIFTMPADHVVGMRGNKK